jgi:hypothetical protein
MHSKTSTATQFPSVSAEGHKVVGIMRPSHDKHRLEYFSTQNQAHLFTTKEFVSFFKLLLPQSQYGTWQLLSRSKMARRRLAIIRCGPAIGGLKDYDNSKSTFGLKSAVRN